MIYLYANFRVGTRWQYFKVMTQWQYFKSDETNFHSNLVSLADYWLIKRLWLQNTLKQIIHLTII